jgi:sulfur-oxidizing protein SoxA
MVSRWIMRQLLVPSLSVCVTAAAHRMVCSEKASVLWRLALRFVIALVVSMGDAWMGSSMAGEISHYSVDGRRSGYTYLSEVNQRLQDDDFANPGLLWVERGRERWTQVDGAAATSCAGCHGDAATSMRGVRTRYPLFDPTRGKLVNLEQQINRCRVQHMQAMPYPR